MSIRRSPLRRVHSQWLDTLVKEYGAVVIARELAARFPLKRRGRKRSSPYSDNDLAAILVLMRLFEFPQATAITWISGARSRDPLYDALNTAVSRHKEKFDRLFKRGTKSDPFADWKEKPILDEAEWLRMQPVLNRRMLGLDPGTGRDERSTKS
jgi:hypothetical protein